ncbi:MAG TPA: helix-turn-helix transcriptional regulator [Bryobacteraceae bacterium]|jgi:DNA-binding CsgD family transcriptional regulator
MKRRLSPRTASDRATPSRQLAGEGVILMDAGFQLVAIDGGAEAILRDLDGQSNGQDGAARLQSEVRKTMNGRFDPEPQLLQVRLGSGKVEYGCRVFPLTPRSEGGMPIIAIYVKREISVMEAVHQVGVDYHLTDREQEALIGISMGLTSKELAERMNISPNTVKAFLRLIMLKMGVATRAGIVGKLLEQNGRASSNGAGR